MISAAWRTWSLLFAAAAWFHILGNALLAEPWGVALLAAAALAVALEPARRWPLVALAAAAAVVAWQEAPLLGNHWLLFTFVAVAVAASGPGERALPLVRACTLGFYVFAAFAKLNADFFDADVTCAGVYLADVTDALRLGGLGLEDRAGWRLAAAVGAAATELAVPVLLVRRATRTAGVVLAVAFHLVVALPDDHQFFDFSSLLLASWVTFLPEGFHDWVRARVPVAGRVRRAVLVVAGVSVGLLGAVAADRGGSARASLVDIGWWAWQPLAVALLVAVVAWSVRTRLAGADVRLLPHAEPAALVPLLVVANGVLPYLEVKTSAGWNMYANLRTAGGETNHLLVPRTFPLTSPQDDLVAVVDSDDPGLAAYRDQGYVLPVRTLRAYLQDRDVDATLRVGDDVVEVEAGEPVPERLGPPVPEVVDRLFVLRAVDVGDPERCQPAFLPAR